MERKDIKMGAFDVIVALVLGIVEGITEWLPVSSTGHMILVNQFMSFSDEEFQSMFLVVVQLGYPVGASRDGINRAFPADAKLRIQNNALA